MGAQGFSAEELKKALLRLLREDEEFRLAAAGALGLAEILEELKRLREDFSRRFEALERKMVENDRRLEALERKMLEHDKRFEVIERKLLEHDEKFRAIMGEIRKLWEEVARLSRVLEALEKRQSSVEEAVKALSAHVTALGHRYGLFTESALRDALRYVIEDVLREYRVDKWMYVDEEGYVFGYKSVIEVDVLIKDREHILVEYKSSVDRSDVAELYRIGRLYERATGVKPKLMIVSPAARKRARELAERLGVELRGVIVED